MGQSPLSYYEGKMSAILPQNCEFSFSGPINPNFLLVSI